MELGDIPTYTAAELERLAHQFLAGRIGAEIDIPVDIEFLLEQLEGVDLDYLSSVRDRYGAEAVVTRDPKTGELIVFVDQHLVNTLPTRYRMTVAEELGHIVLHGFVIEQVNTLEDFRNLQNHPLWFQLERNAKRRAAAILMPPKPVLLAAEELYPRLVKIAGYGNREAVKKQLAVVLARRFEVSTAAMSFRLTEWPVQVSVRIDHAMEHGLDSLGGAGTEWACRRTRCVDSSVSAPLP